MTVDELMSRIGEHVSARRAFGEPIEREGVTVVPVAMVLGGGGGGTGTGEDGSAGQGGGAGGISRGIGAYVIRGGEVRYVPAYDVAFLALLAFLALARLTRGRRRRRG